MQIAENRNESALQDERPLVAELRARSRRRANVPIVSVVHCVVWVSELAVCSSSGLAMVGRMDARPLVKNGEANISSPLST